MKNKVARHVSGKATGKHYCSRKTMKVFKDIHSDAESRQTKKRRARLACAEAAINSRRPTAQLGGYFRYNTDAQCKVFTQEEIDNMNKKEQDDE